jgi:hypothetical protein
MFTFTRAAVSALLVGSIAIVAACSDTAVATPTTTTPKPVCPNTVPEAVAASTKCNSEGYSCGVGFGCVGGFAQQAQCTCTGGAYKCTAGFPTATDIPVDTTDMNPFCKATNPPAEACPAAVANTDGTTCKTAGKTCYYTGKTCPPDTQPLTDVCMCRASLSDAGLAWLCEPKVCNPKADAGP